MAFGDLTLIGSVNNKDASTTRTITPGGTIAAGTTLMLFVAHRDSSGTGANATVSDNVNGSWTETQPVADFLNSSGTTRGQFFVFSNNASIGTSDTITIANVVSGQTVHAVAWAAEGLTLSSPAIAANFASASTTSALSSGTISYVSGNELWIGIFYIAHSETGDAEDSDYTNFYVQSDGSSPTAQARSVRIASRVVSSTLTDDYNITEAGTSNTRVVAVISFAQAAAAGGYVPRMLMTGVG